MLSSSAALARWCLASLCGLQAWEEEEATSFCPSSEWGLLLLPLCQGCNRVVLYLWIVHLQAAEGWVLVAKCGEVRG